MTAIVPICRELYISYTLVFNAGYPPAAYLFFFAGKQQTCWTGDHSTLYQSPQLYCYSIQFLVEEKIFFYM